ncbi:MAG: DUF4192 domain-containing protein [Propionibacteriaceae bacterium]|nr:DUF4192 domain-containing protein [Propionibacteriaceae bacterium]
MTETHLPPTLRLSEPHDLLGAIPYLLEYHPTDSLVFLLLSGRRLVVTARLALTPQETPTGTAIAHFLDHVAAEHGADGIVLVAYHADHEWAGDHVLEIVCGLERLAVLAALVADGCHWWPGVCGHEPWETCDCDRGRPYDVTTSVAAAHAVWAGITAMPSRQALADSVAGPVDQRERAAAAAAMEAALTEICDLTLAARRERITQLIDRHCAGEELSGSEHAQLAVLVYEGAIRDVAVARIEEPDAHLHVTLWRRVVAVTVAPFESAPLCLLGLAAWVGGNGALQVVCMERAERINPDYSLLQILDEINAQALAPAAWETLRAA